MIKIYEKPEVLAIVRKRKNIIATSGNGGNVTEENSTAYRNFEKATVGGTEVKYSW